MYKPTIEDKAICILNRLHLLLKDRLVEQITFKKDLLDDDLVLLLVDAHNNLQILNNTDSTEFINSLYDIITNI